MGRSSLMTENKRRRTRVVRFDMKFRSTVCLLAKRSSSMQRTRAKVRLGTGLNNAFTTWATIEFRDITLRGIVQKCSVNLPAAPMGFCSIAKAGWSYAKRRGEGER